MAATLTELGERGRVPFGEAVGLHAVAAPETLLLRRPGGGGPERPPSYSQESRLSPREKEQLLGPREELRPAHRSTIRWQRGRSSCGKRYVMPTALTTRKLKGHTCGGGGEEEGGPVRGRAEASHRSWTQAQS